MSVNDFDIIQKIGEGAFSAVFKVLRKSDGKVYAMKNIKMGKLSSKEKENSINEVRFLASLNSPEIIKYKEAFYDEKFGMLHIIMECCEGGDLLEKISNLKKANQYLNEKVIWIYIIQMIRGLKCLHDLKILHRDFKCANIMLTQNHQRIKLGDLNVSKIAKEGLLHTQTGTPYYASPEVWNDKPYNSKSDVWSLGCVIYELTTLNHPFQSDSMDELFKKITLGKYDQIPQRYSKDLSNIISQCLQVNPINRLNTTELLDQYSSKNLLFAQQISSSKECDTKEFDVQQKLLKTLRIGKNLNQLNDILPGPQYELTSARSNVNKKSKTYFLSNSSVQLNINQDNHIKNKLLDNIKQISQSPQNLNNKFFYSPILPQKKNMDNSNNKNNMNKYQITHSQNQIPSSNYIPSQNQIQSEQNLDVDQKRQNIKSQERRSKSIQNLLPYKFSINLDQIQNQNIYNSTKNDQSSIPTLPHINKNNLAKIEEDDILQKEKQINQNKKQSFINKLNNQQCSSNNYGRIKLPDRTRRNNSNIIISQQK